MGNVAAAAFKQVKADGFSKDIFHEVLTYNFANDAGAFADVVRLGQADGPLLIWHAVAFVETACTSGGSATVIIGVTGDTDAFMTTSSGAVANLAINTAHTISTTNGAVYMADDDYFLFDIGTADLLTGKVHLHVFYTATTK